MVERRRAALEVRQGRLQLLWGTVDCRPGENNVLMIGDFVWTPWRTAIANETLWLAIRPLKPSARRCSCGGKKQIEHNNLFGSCFSCVRRRFYAPQINVGVDSRQVPI